MKIPVGLSNHHIHITQEVCEILFGKNYKLTNKRNLKQIGQYACNETLDVEINGKILNNLRIIGPCRNYNQVELLKRDYEYFNIPEVWSDSGKLDNTTPFKLIGPCGTYYQDNGAFIANNHIHFSKKDLKNFNLENITKVDIIDKNNNVLRNITIKSDETCALEFHLNKDEGEKLNIETFDEIEINKKYY